MTDLVAVIAPRAELHEAGLLVEGKVTHVDLARGLEDGGRSPEHFARVVQHRLRHRRHHVLSVRAATQGYRESKVHSWIKRSQEEEQTEVDLEVWFLGSLHDYLEVILDSQGVSEHEVLTPRGHFGT